MTIREKLLNIQTELKAPKGQYNNFGGYKYRSCEDILEAVKPILKEQGLCLTLHDEMIEVGNRVYVQASAIIRDIKTDECIVNKAYAREAEQKAKMDDSQITGTASSYARKYALNGLFLIDDTKDADTDEFTKTTSEVKKDEKATEKQLSLIRDLAKAQGKEVDETIISRWTKQQASDFIAKYRGGLICTIHRKK